MTSKQVTSNQPGTHGDLEKVVRKHLSHEWRKPYKSFSSEVFSTVADWLKRDNVPFILDSGCGVGDSTFNLALAYPHYRVLGFDRSEARLDKLSNRHELPENGLVIRAEAEDLWRQLVDAKLFPIRHYILFPNPYPKAAQLNKRWHGSPVFPTLVSLGGTIELRSNWKNYLEEFSLAWSIATGQSSIVETYVPAPSITAFEEKYHQSQQTLWRLVTSGV